MKIHFFSFFKHVTVLLATSAAAVDATVALRGFRSTEELTQKLELDFNTYAHQASES